MARRGFAHAGNRIVCESADPILKRFGNQLGALGEGKARTALGRAINRAGRTTYTATKRALKAQTSIPAGIVNREIKYKAAAFKGKGALEFVIYGRGSEIPLREFKPKQTESGASAIVWGRRQVYAGTFAAPGDNPAVVAALNGGVYHRVGKARLPIQRTYGPSVPKEMLKDQTKETFERVSAEALEKRLQHELNRMLTG